MPTITVSTTTALSATAYAAGDDVVVESTGNLTVDINASITGLAMDGPVTVNSGVTLTLAGDCTQGNALFTLGSGSGNAHLVFDAAAATRKWLGATGPNQANCKVVISGTSAARCSITRTGANFAYFDSGDEGAGTVSNSFGWDAQYCDFAGITNSAGTLAIGRCDFGNHNFRFRHCDFDACGTVLALRGPNWNSATLDFLIEDCRWSNSPSGSTNLYALIGGTASTTGVKAVRRCAFDKTPDIGTSGASGPLVEDNYFDAFLTMSRIESFSGNVVRMPSNLAIMPAYCDITDVYMMADHRLVGNTGNPHFIAASAADLLFEDLLFEYPYEAQIDMGDPIHGGLGAAIIRRVIILPSETDGRCAGNNITNPSSPGATDYELTIEHCTVYGKVARIAFAEAEILDQDYISVKSNIVAAPNPADDTERARVLADETATPPTFVDVLDPTQATRNYLFNAIPYTHPVTGLTHDGYVGRLSSAPVGDIYDTTTGPQFVDPTRNFGNWAVSKGVANSGDPLVTKLDATRTLLMNDPTLGTSELMPWVRAGFAPRNPALLAAHDAAVGGWIGAVQGVASGPSGRLKIRAGSGSLKLTVGAA